ncbi:MAG: BatD family protein [Prevotellaceae bacterium]|nr:BatD family protein [Prevotellaceae bacterium]
MKFNIFKLILGLGLFFILPYTAISQQVIFKAEAPNIVSEGEFFNFSLTSNVSLNGRLTSKPEFAPNFNEIASGERSITNITNTKVEQSFILNFTLQAIKEGKFTIGAVSMVDDDGKTHTSNAVTIEVIKGQAPQQNPQTPAASVDNSASDVFIRFIPSRTSLYRGDNLTLTLKLYVGLQTEFDGINNISLPDFDGFWAKDITPAPNSANMSKWQRENIDGRLYNAIVLKTWTLSPQKSGAIRITSANITAVVKQRVRRSIFFDDSYQIEKKIRTSPITVNVKDLPSGAPASFTGAVGNYTMTSKLSKNQLTANDATSLNIKISGTGNFSLIGTPKINFPHDFDTYDPQKTTTSNSVNFEYQLIPRSAGTFTIEPVVFSYFNPTDGKYVTLTSNPMIIEVEKDLNSSQQVAFVNPTNQRDVQILASDIRFIKNKIQTWQSKGSRFLGMKNFYVSYIIAVLLFAVVYLLLHKHGKNRQNIVLMRNRKAKGIAKKRLKIAANSMKRNNASAFYDELLKAVWGYISDKFSLPVAELSRNNVSELLNEKNVEQKYIDQLIRIVDECEFAQYASAGINSSQMHLLYNETIEVMSKLEQKTK